MKRHKRIYHRCFLLIFSILLVFCSVALISRFGGEDTYVVAKRGTFTDTVKVEGLFLYEETVVTAEESGTFYPGLLSGDAVSAGEICGEFHRLNDLFTEPVTVMVSPCSGIYSSAIDGWETVLTEERLTSLDLPMIFDVEKETEDVPSSFCFRGEPCFKVIENKKELSLLMALGQYRPEGDSLRFIFENEVFRGKIRSCRYFEHDLYAIVSITPRDSCFENRKINVDVILEEQEGILVDTSALFTRFGKIGVYRREGKDLKFCPVSVLCGDDDFSLVTGISEGDPLLLGKS